MTVRELIAELTELGELYQDVPIYVTRTSLVELGEIEHRPIGGQVDIYKHGGMVELYAHH